ncbi:MAG: hypothetical protein ACTSSH_09365, partial [Candidatus Heimdallarchaeota archaeon]
MIEQWVADGPIKSPTSKVEVYTSIPDEIIEEFCKVATEIVNQQPLGDLEIGEMITTPESFRQQEKMFTDMGRDWITMLAREADGSISGLTDMRYNPGRETMISQGLTGVQESYRGRGLGKWLKASMLLKIKNDYPQVKIVSTTNATTNAPMISINDRLGFKVH